MKRTVSGTVQQQIFDALVAHPNGLTYDEIAQALQLPKSSIHTAVSALRKAHLCPVETCRQPSRYRIPQGTPRPSDGRGRKP